MTTKKVPKLSTLQLALFTVMIAGFCFTRISDYDFWWHISLGRDFFTWGFSDLTEKFSYTFLGAEQFRGEWLADLILFLSVKVAGLAGANFILFLTVSATLIFMYKTMEIDQHEAEEISFYTYLLTLILVLLAIRFRLFIRPYIFSYLFVIIFIYLLKRYRRDGDVRLLYWLPLIELFWVNMSKGAFFGPLIFGLFIVAQAISGNKDWKPAVVLLGVVLASLLSPEMNNFYKLLFQYRPETAGVEVGEHQPLSTQLLWGYGLKYTFGYQLLFLLSIFSLVFLKGWKNYFHLMLFGAFFLPTFLMIRMIDFFAIVAGITAVPAVETLLKSVLNRCSNKMFFSLFFLLALVVLVLFSTLGSHTYTIGIGAKADAFPEGALEFVNKHNIHGRMFNSYPFGGYLTWAAPDRPVFIDGRGGHLYGAKFHKEYKKMLHTPVAWQDAEDQWNFDYAILEYDRKSFGQHFPTHLTDNRAWALVYWDNISAVYLKRTPANNPVIESFEYKVAKPAFYNFSYAAELLKQFGSAEILAQIDKEIRYNPLNQEPRLLKAYLLFTVNKRGQLNQQILDELDECLRLKPDMAMEHSAKAMILFEEKRMDEAADEVKKAVAIDPGDNAAKFVAEKLKIQTN